MVRQSFMLHMKEQRVKGVVNLGSGLKGTMGRKVSSVNGSHSY